MKRPAGFLQGHWGALLGPLLLLGFGLIPALATARPADEDRGPANHVPKPPVASPLHASSAQYLSSSVNPVALGQALVLTAHFPALADGSKVTF